MARKRQLSVSPLSIDGIDLNALFRISPNTLHHVVGGGGGRSSSCELSPLPAGIVPHERFDSVFRRNLIEIEDTEHTIAGRRKFKQSYKFKKR